ncbi:MAG: ABC transporter ATP-binding protein [Rhodococcus sp. (in: high G+C Gram-positive bacteria)]|uniref:ABC transporter ATP-binding protein n=1 Tax=Rhodococcus sp. TaxID=1831 RepID=UPI003BB4A87E
MNRGDTVVEVSGMSRRYGSGKDAFVAVRDLDLTVRDGELFGLLGTNGAGKTSTLEVIQGLSRPTAGTIRVFGVDPVAGRRQIRPDMGIMLQRGGLPQDLTVRESLTMWAGTCSDPLPVDSVLDRVDMLDRAPTRVKSLSGGEARRLDLACALIGQPRLLFLDEPTTGLDPESRRNTWRLIADLKASGVTIMLTTHYLDEAESLCDRLAIMHRGTVARSGTVADVVADHPATIRFRHPAMPLPNLPGTDLTIDGDTVVLRTTTLQDTLTDLLLWARHHDLHLDGLDARVASLESVFLSIADELDRRPTPEGVPA